MFSSIGMPFSHQSHSRELCNSTTPAPWVDRLCTRKRAEMYRLVARQVALDECRLVLDVGVTTDHSWEAANYFEHSFPDIRRIIGLAIENPAHLGERYPGLRCVQGDGRRLPFADGAFDMAFSSAVIEHVGNFAQQGDFIRELHRVSRRYAVFTTPNRWPPIEVHTLLPLLHWLPKRWHRKALARLGFTGAAEEANLNLLSARDIRALCRKAGTPPPELHSIRLCGLRSNWVVIIRKEAEVSPALHPPMPRLREDK